MPSVLLRSRALGPCPLRPRAPVDVLKSLTRQINAPKREVRCNNSVGDDLLDFVTAGPKLRKWYGQGPRLPRDGGEPPEEPEQGPAQEPEGPREAILVTDAESATGEQVILQLILARAPIRAVVANVGAARSGYGPYVDPVSVSVDDRKALARALRGVRVVVALGRLGRLLPAAKEAGVEQVVLVSTAGMPRRGGLAALFKSREDSLLQDASREAAVAAAGIPYVIIKTGDIADVPGGSSSLQVSKMASSSSSSSGGGGGSGAISREDLAAAVAGCVLGGATAAAAEGGVVISVLQGGPGRPPADWQQVMGSLA